MGYWYDWHAERWVDFAERAEGTMVVPPKPLSPIMQKLTGCATMGDFMKSAYEATANWCKADLFAGVNDKEARRYRKPPKHQRNCNHA